MKNEHMVEADINTYACALLKGRIIDWTCDLLKSAHACVRLLDHFIDECLWMCPITQCACKQDIAVSMCKCRGINNHMGTSSRKRITNYLC